MSPSEIIREELRLREARGELTHDRSPLLIKLTSLYRVTIFQAKPQMFPGSDAAALNQGPSSVNNYTNIMDMSKDITLDDIKGYMRQSYRNSTHAS